MTTQFNIPATIIIGGGASQATAAQVKRLQARRVLLVTDSFLAKNGVAAQIKDGLEKDGLSVSLFSGVQPDPTDQNILAGLVQCKESRSDLIIGLGGGSSLDAAKVISILVNNELPLSQYAGYHKVPCPGVPMIAIPTTAGTGSEVTKVAVITDTARDVKMMLLDISLLPTVALVDYELTMTMPPALTAHVGVDSLVHGIEAYVSKKANALTDPIALAGIRSIAENLRTAFREPNNKKAREAMMLAACQAGMAFANSSVCLVHGMSRPLGAYYHVPHGLSNAVLLPAVTEFSLPGAPERYADIARVMKYATAADSNETAGIALVKGLKELNSNLKIPGLSECVKVDRSAFTQKTETMANDALASGSPQNNPVVPDVPQMVRLYQSAW
jgi:alcohol dehydrogenase class IV